MGVLSGYKIVEFAGIGPAPMCAMLLSDMGAEVLRLDRAEDANLGISTESKYNLLGRGRRSVAIDLKRREGTELALKLIERADALIEGFRPGVMERLGLAPDVCQARNPKLVYGRMTGWGQDGPLALAAGHDINYIALTGAYGEMKFLDEDMFADPEAGKVMASWRCTLSVKGEPTSWRGLDLMHFKGDKLAQKLTYAKTKVPLFQS